MLYCIPTYLQTTEVIVMKNDKTFLLLAVLCIATFCYIPHTLALEEFIHVNIEPYSNTKLVGHQWWTLNEGDNTYSLLPIGEVGEFEGPDKKIKFKIIDGGIVLFGTNATRWPKAVNDIKVGGIAKAVYFFHATGWEANGVTSYKFVMNYRGGGTEELEMISGFNSDNWCHEESPLQDENSVWGWKAKEKPACNHAGLITTKWINPKPDTEIATIDAISLATTAVPIITAITLGEASLDVHPVQKLSLTWGSLKQSF